LNYLTKRLNKKNEQPI